jgi:hypothetical protein
VSSAIRAIVMPSPVPGAAGAAVAPAVGAVGPGDPRGPVSLEMAPLPRARHAGSIADVGEPIPLTWIVRSGVVIGVVIVVAIGLAIATHCRGSEPAKPLPGASAGSASRSEVPARTLAGSGSSAGKPADRDAALGVAIHDLELGKTCADRRAAVGRLATLRDPRAVPPLKRALAKAGPGDDGNGCLKADAERAVRELGAK